MTADFIALLIITVKILHYQGRGETVGNTTFKKRDGCAWKKTSTMIAKTLIVQRLNS